MIKVVCFDIGGTLLDSGPGFVGAFTALVNGAISRDDFRDCFSLARGTAASDLRHSCSVFNVDYEIAYGLYLKAREREVHLFDDVLPTLSEMAALGIKCVALSNASAWSIRPLRGAETHLTNIFYSFEIRAAKPDVEAFCAVEQALGVGGSEILMVGDSPAYDYDGALHAGWKAVLLDRHGQYAATDMRRINDLRQLYNLVLSCNESPEAVGKMP